MDPKHNMGSADFSPVLVQLTSFFCSSTLSTHFYTSPTATQYTQWTTTGVSRVRGQTSEPLLEGTSKHESRG